MRPRPLLGSAGFRRPCPPQKDPSDRIADLHAFALTALGCRIKKLGWQSWLARLLFQGGQVGIRVAAEAGAQGPGLPAVVETLAEFGPSLAADPTQLARGGGAQPRRRGRDQAHLTTQHGGRGGRFAPTGPALVVALRAEQMLEVVVGAWQ